jgi:hypothetical protein
MWSNSSFGLNYQLKDMLNVTLKIGFFALKVFESPFDDPRRFLEAEQSNLARVIARQLNFNLMVFMIIF